MCVCVLCVTFRYLFRSGNSEHPSDRFYNTTVEILPFSLPENSYIWSAYNLTTDGFLIVGSFNEFGIAEGTIEAKIGKIREIRLHVHTDSENWAILSEVSGNVFNVHIVFSFRFVRSNKTFHLNSTHQKISVTKIHFMQLAARIRNIALQTKAFIVLSHFRFIYRTQLANSKCFCRKCANHAVRCMNMANRIQ